MKGNNSSNGQLAKPHLIQQLKQSIQQQENQQQQESIEWDFNEIEFLRLKKEEKMKQKMARREMRRPKTLSQFLKQIQFFGPYSLKAKQVLPILINNYKSANRRKSNGGDDYEQEGIEKFAFFYQFKDNFIYNFNYADTFIEEIVLKQYVLEITSKKDLRGNENNSDGSDYDLDLDEEEFEQNEYYDNENRIYEQEGYVHTQHDLSGIKGKRRGGNSSNKKFTPHKNSHNKYHSISLNDQSQKSIENKKLQRRSKVKSVTNELFDQIIYYPVLNNSLKREVIAIIEVCYEQEQFYNKLQNCDSLQTFGHQQMGQQERPVNKENIKEFLDKFRHQLSSFSNILELFCCKISKILDKNQNIRLSAAFNNLKENKILKEQEQYYQVKQQEQNQKTEYYFNEYIKNLDCYDQELKKLVDEREKMINKVKDMKVEKKAKLKFLASALFFCTTIERKMKFSQQKNALQQWKQGIYLQKIAESAFNKVLELNHKHSYARYKAGCFLIKNTLKDNQKKLLNQTYKILQKFVKFNSLKLSSSMMYQKPNLDMTGILSNQEQLSSQLFGNVKGSFARNYNVMQPYQQYSNASNISLNQSSNMMRQSLDIIANQTNNSLNYQFPNQHSLSMVLSDAHSSNKSNTKRSKSKKRQQ